MATTFTQFAQSVAQQYMDFLYSPEYCGNTDPAPKLDPLDPKYVRALGALLACAVNSADNEGQIQTTYCAEDALPGYLAPDRYLDYTVCSAARSFVGVVDEIAGDKTE